MKTVRKSNERGHFNFGWLDTYHTFSFGSYFDPKWMGFKKLRVINEDYIDEGKGFDTHPHRDMEILTFILEGAIEHRDTMGHHTIIKPGEIQMMSAGTGLMHSEFNPHSDQKTRMLQIWIEPDKLGIKPRYDQFEYENEKNKMNRIADSEGGNKVAKVNQDLKLDYGNFEKGQEHSISLDKERSYWLHVVDGSMTIEDSRLTSGDAIALSEEESLSFRAEEDSQFLLFNLAS